MLTRAQSRRKAEDVAAATAADQQAAAAQPPAQVTPPSESESAPRRKEGCAPAPATTALMKEDAKYVEQLGSRLTNRFAG